MTIRLFRDSDRDGLISLLQTVFDGWHADPLAHWKWLYENNPQGKSSIAIAVEDGGIVASYSACPVLMHWVGQLEKLGFKRAFTVKRLVKVLNWSRAMASRLNLPGRSPTAAEVVARIH